LVLGAGLGSAAVEVWDLQAKRPLYCHQLSSLISVNFSPDGQLLLMRDYDGLKVCESQTGHVLYTLDRGYYGLHMSSDSETCLALANGSDLIRQWNLKTGEMIQSWPLPKLSYDDRARLFSPDGRVLCSTPSDNHRLLGVSDYSEKIKEEDIKLWDWRTGELLSAVPVNIHSEGEPWLEGVIPHKLDQGRHLRHGHQIYEVQFTPDGRFIVTSGGDYTIRIWGSPASDPTIQFRYPEPDIGESIKKLREWAISRAWMGNFE
jgi:WD40 repeat protein